MKHIIAGLNLFQTFKASIIPYSLSTIYRLYHRILLNQSHIRSYLLRRSKKPPDNSELSSPLFQTISNLSESFIGEVCPVSAFHRYFQVSFL